MRDVAFVTHGVQLGLGERDGAGLRVPRRPEPSRLVSRPEARGN